MIFRQITHDDLGCASYVIGDEHAGVAAVVDLRLQPRRPRLGSEARRGGHRGVDGGVGAWRGELRRAAR